jgi:hypothetical protein
MLPEELHTGQIERFYRTRDKVRRDIEAEPDPAKKKNLALQYFQLTELWTKIDAFIEYTVKSELDSIDAGQNAYFPEPEPSPLPKKEADRSGDDRVHRPEKPALTRPKKVDTLVKQIFFPPTEKKAGKRKKD